VGGRPEDLLPVFSLPGRARARCAPHTRRYQHQHRHSLHKYPHSSPTPLSWYLSKLMRLSADTSVVWCLWHMVLAGLQLDGALGWSWFGVTTPLWIPIGLAAPVFMCAPLAIWRQHAAAGDDAALSMQAKASCVGCVIAFVLVGSCAATASMLCYKLDAGAVGDGHSSFTYLQAIIPLLVVEGLMGLSFVGMPRDALLQGLLWKVLRCTFVVLLACKVQNLLALPVQQYKC
jgi:hypothetical protein